MANSTYRPASNGWIQITFHGVHLFGSSTPFCKSPATQVSPDQKAALYREMVPRGVSPFILPHIKRPPPNRSENQYEQAEPLFQRALAIKENALGPDHPDTAMTLNNLAILYWNQSKYEQAEPLFQRALAIREKALGADHPETVKVRENYTNLLQKMKKRAE